MGSEKILSCALLTLQLLASIFGDDVPQPFRVVWNYPDAPCKALHVNFELDKFHIAHNEHKFVEDTIAIFYSDQAGKWPYIHFRNGNRYIFGGLPKDVDMASHLEKLKEVIGNALKPDAHGFGIIDMENWRPVFHTNYGRYTPYKAIFTELIEKENPDMPRQERRRLGNKLWLNASLSLMVQSIEAAKETRPHDHWGYYGYPQYVTKNQNGQLGALWKAITAYYPSIYLRQLQNGDEKRERIKADIAESFRVRAEYGNPNDPLMPYTLAQSTDLGLLHGEWLQMEIRLPLEMGVDGLILWASSKEFMPPKEKCAEENKFVHTVLGPLIEDELEYMKKCSGQICAGRGRCVRKEYTDKYPYLKTRGVPEDILSTATDSGVNAMSMDEVDAVYKEIEYVCQCYDGAAGDRCTQHYK